jgi:hypothetical protein
MLRVIIHNVLGVVRVGGELACFQFVQGRFVHPPPPFTLPAVDRALNKQVVSRLGLSLSLRACPHQLYRNGTPHKLSHLALFTF